MVKYKRLHRTTLAQTDGRPLVGVYVLAYMGTVVYVGKAEESVAGRLQSHWYAADPVGSWMRRVDDWENVRLDVLGPAEDSPLWVRQAEDALIKRFRPLFNTALVPA